MNFAPGMWLSPLLDSRNSVEAVISESAFTTADFDCSEFQRISNMDGKSFSFADVESSQYQDVWNDSDYAEFSGLWSLAA